MYLDGSLGERLVAHQVADFDARDHTNAIGSVANCAWQAGAGVGLEGLVSMFVSWLGLARYMGVALNAFRIYWGCYAGDQTNVKRRVLSKPKLSSGVKLSGRVIQMETAIASVVDGWQHLP